MKKIISILLATMLCSAVALSTVISTSAAFNQEAKPKKGDTVFVVSLSKCGVLSNVSPKGDGEVKFGNLSVRVKKGDFYKVKK